MAGMSTHLAITRPEGVTPVPDPTVLEALGFRKSNRSILHYETPVGPPDWHVSLIIELDPTSGLWGEVVLDNDFGQPYHYMAQSPVVADRFKHDIDMAVRRLVDAGLTDIHVDHALYGVSR